MYRFIAISFCFLINCLTEKGKCKQIKIPYQFCCRYPLIIYPVCVSIIIASTHTTVTINHGFTGEIRALLDTWTTEKSESGLDRQIILQCYRNL